MNDSLELLKRALSEWGALYGKPISERAIEAWVRIFAGTHPALLAAGLESLTRRADRMPTPGMLTKELELIREQKPWLNPNAARNPRSTPSKDQEGRACVRWSDEPRLPAYRAVDCSEGREFLTALARISGKKTGHMAKLMARWSKEPVEVRR
jgi:hypothetical protein